MRTGSLPSWCATIVLVAIAGASSRMGAAVTARLCVVASPCRKESAVMGDEVLLLVRWERGDDGAHEQVVELGRGEPVVRDLVEMREVGRAELLVRVDLEVVVGQPA